MRSSIGTTEGLGLGRVMTHTGACLAGGLNAGHANGMMNVSLALG